MYTVDDIYKNHLYRGMYSIEYIYAGKKRCSFNKMKVCVEVDAPDHLHREFEQKGTKRS